MSRLTAKPAVPRSAVMLARLWNAAAVSSTLVRSGRASAQRMTGGSVSSATVSGPSHR